MLVIVDLVLYLCHNRFTNIFTLLILVKHQYLKIPIILINILRKLSLILGKWQLLRMRKMGNGNCYM